MATNNFVSQVCKLVKILVATGHKSDAEKIRDKAVLVLDDPRLRSAVNDAEKKIGGENGIKQERDHAQTGEQYLRQQLELANAGNYCAKFQLWQGFSQGEVTVFDLHGQRIGKNEVTKDPAEADKWLS